LNGFVQAESWPCDLAVPDIPGEVFVPAAAILGQVIFYQRKTVCIKITFNGKLTVLKTIKFRSTSLDFFLGSTVYLCGGYNGATVYYSECSKLGIKIH